MKIWQPLRRLLFQYKTEYRTRNKALNALMLYTKELRW